MLREVQIPLLASLLLIAAAAKLFFREDGPGLGVALGGRRSLVVGVALAEGTLGLALLVTPLGLVRLANVVFFATATWVAGDLTRRGSNEGCGCFGALSTAPPGYRGVARGVLLTIAAIASGGVPQTGAQILGGATAGFVALLGVESALLLALSPEVAGAVDRTRRSAPCEEREVPLDETYGVLRSSDVWRAYEEMLASSTPVEVWRELCHRYVVFAAHVDEQPAEVVFAVPIGSRRVVVRAGVVRDSAGRQQDDGSGPDRVHSPA